ncbi:MAG: hypothetical protein KDA78_13275, partial [Planctomycetaceae bacterium]|nr:hypothetical protein [Planctomycetaceae bacterium]
MRLLIIPFLCLLTFSPLNISANAADRPDVLIADFEQPTYGDWTVEGEAFGTGPAQGTLPGQMHVGGYHGKGLVNSFKNGDRTTGKLTSPEFKLQRPWINFLIGGGAHEGETCMNLLIDGKIVLTATGPNANAGGSEELEQQSWDISEWSGKAATIQIVDQHTGGWGHINVDQIVLSDTKAGPTLVELQKELLVNNSHLIVPVANRGKQQLLEIYQGDRLIQNFNVVLPEQGATSWLAAYPLSHFQLDGQKIQLRFSGSRRQPETLSEAFHAIHIGTAQEARQQGDYSQPYRDQFHVTTRRGWNND